MLAMLLFAKGAFRSSLRLLMLRSAKESHRQHRQRLCRLPIFLANFGKNAERAVPYPNDPLLDSA
jgi:hypothetical protein